MASTRGRRASLSRYKDPRAGLLRQHDSALRVDHDQPLQPPALKHRLACAVSCAADVEEGALIAPGAKPVASTAAMTEGCRRVRFEAGIHRTV